MYNLVLLSRESNLEVPSYSYFVFYFSFFAAASEYVIILRNIYYIHIITLRLRALATLVFCAT